MSLPIVKVGLLQSYRTAQLEENLARTEAQAREAVGRGAQLLALPELVSSLYFCQEEAEHCFDLAEPLPGPTTERFRRLAKELGVTILVPFFERAAAGVYFNSQVIYGPAGELLGHYRKMHIPDDPQFMEKYYFTPGDRGFQAVTTPAGVVGPLICWDQWYPEAARLTALRGAELLVYPTAIGWLPAEKGAEGLAMRDAWQTMQRSHAIANGVFVIAVNRTGQEGPSATGIEFWGHSFVADPFGRVIGQAGDGEEVLVVECDLRQIEATRRTWPFLRDRRCDTFADLTKRWIGNAP